MPSSASGTPTVRGHPEVVCGMGRPLGQALPHPPAPSPITRAHPAGMPGGLGNGRGASLSQVPADHRIAHVLGAD
eukprot:scaffold73814_cov39-Phaeocystis_antarctica.AAC.1